MRTWRPTPALVRAALVAAVALSASLATGTAPLAVLAAPFVVLAALALVSRPRSVPVVTSTIDHHLLHEGQATTVRLVVDDTSGVEHVTRVVAPAPNVATAPAHGCVGALVADGVPELAVSPRRWGRRSVAAERVALVSAWAGWRCGPVDVRPHGLFVLPQDAAYVSHAELPQPDGLVGAHRSRRVGSGTEVEGVRRFVPGDRLRRISWRVSLRTGDLHVVDTRAEQDAGVWLVVDALRDIGVSGGVDGAASTLDLGVRAAATLARHHVRRGDRVGLVVLSADQARVPLGSGPRHLQRILGRLARIRTDSRATPGSVDLRLGAGSVVHVLSPLLFAPLVTATVAMQDRGLSVVVIDTLDPRVLEGRGPTEALAWRMRELDRRDRIDALSRRGCPVVRWQGSGSLDVVLHHLTQRARLPRVVRRR